MTFHWMWSNIFCFYTWEYPWMFLCWQIFGSKSRLSKCSFVANNNSWRRLFRTKLYYYVWIPVYQINCPFWDNYNYNFNLVKYINVININIFSWAHCRTQHKCTLSAWLNKYSNFIALVWILYILCTAYFCVPGGWQHATDTDDFDFVFIAVG